MTMHARRSPLAAAILLALSATTLAGLSACGGPSAPTPEAPPPAAAAPPAAEEVPAATAAEQEAAAAATAREAELKAKEVEMQLREQALADREAAAAASAAAARQAAAARPATPAKPAAAAKPSASAPAPAAAPPPPPVTIPVGTPLSVKLNEGYSTKTTPLGQAVTAQLASDLVVDGRRVAKAGATLRGSVTEVTSGSNKVGAVPALKIDFTQLVLADGSTATINARIAQKGPSEKGRDTAKIVGGTAAGAIIGHQVDSGSGKVIGGIIGGAAGAAAAKKTGTEAEIAAGSVVPATLRTAFTYDGR
jgi:Glycine zipper 2TM domain